MTCRTSIHCYRSETCPDTNCPEHPDQPWNKWGAGRPLTTTDGGEQVNGSIAIQLHRQVMPPEPTAKRDRANALFWTIFVFAIASFAALIFLGVEPSLPFQPSEKP